MFIHNIEYETIIKEYFIDKRIGSIQTTANKFLKLYPNIKEYLKIYLISIPEWETIKHIIYGIVLSFDLPKCKHCGKYIKYSSYKVGAKYCSNKCCNSDEDFLKQKEQIVQERYGCSSVLKRKDIRLQIKNTVKQKIADNPNYYKDREEKTRQTKIKKYGSLENYKQYRNKIYQDIARNRYGTDYIFQNDQVKQKIKNTIEQHKQENPNYYKDIFDKLHQKNFQLYGYYTKGIEHAWNTILIKWKDYIKPVFTHEEFIGLQNKVYKWQCMLCGNIFESKIYATGHLKEIDSQIPRCLHCFPKKSGKSKKEEELLKFIQQYFPNAAKTRKLIFPEELDIVIPEIKLAIEFNGCYYHSIFNKIQNYHLNKTLKCNQKRI